MPGERSEDARLQTDLRIRTGPKVLDMESLTGRMGDEVVMQERKLRRCHLSAVFPPHSLLCKVVADDIFVLRAAARVYASLGAERAAGRELGFTAGNSAFVQFRLMQIPVQRLKISEAEFVCPEFRVADAPTSCFLPEYSSARVRYVDDNRLAVMRRPAWTPQRPMPIEGFGKTCHVMLVCRAVRLRHTGDKDIPVQKPRLVDNPCTHVTFGQTNPNLVGRGIEVGRDEHIHHRATARSDRCRRWS